MSTGQTPQQTAWEDDGAGYLIAVSDLMAGLLFIFIITLMAFVLNFQQKSKQAEIERQELLREQKRYSLIVDDLTNIGHVRDSLLEDIGSKLRQLGVQVETDLEHGIVHLTEQAINFPSGQAILPEEELAKLAKVGDVLVDTLPCYTADPPAYLNCSPEHAGKLESVFIEGHTDNVPLRDGSRKFQDNWDLSAQRAIFAYRSMVIGEQPLLGQLTNTAGFPIFSVSGYGEGRPRNRYEAPTADAANRRIDLRFIMTPPSDKNIPMLEKLEGAL